MKRQIFLSVILTLILVGSMIGFLIRRNNHLRNQCTNNLRQLYHPMHCCVPMEQGLTNGATLNPKDVAQCIKGGKIPKCPCGPEYKIIWVVGGPPPKCPYHGDLLATLSNINDHKKAEQVQSEPDIIIAKAIESYRAKPYAELVKMVDTAPNIIDVKWSCSKDYQVAIWAMWESESNGNICVMGMVNAKEDTDTLIPHKRSFIKSPDNQFVGGQDKHQNNINPK